MSFPSLLRFAPVARIIGLLSVTLALGGCSAMKLGYQNLPHLAQWWLNGYVDFDHSQAARVRDDLDQLHAWHRTTELPGIAQLLQQVEQLAAADVTPAQVCALEPPLRLRWAALRQRAEPMLARHALTLTAAQLQHLERKYARNNREYTREWIQASPAERVDKRLKQVVERAERVYGHLDDRQRALLREQLQASRHDPAIILAERRRRQQDTLAVLGRLAGQAVPQEAAVQALRGLMDRYADSPDSQYRAFVQDLRQETCRLVASLHNATSPQQREHAVRRLQGWQRDAAELSSDR